MHSGSWRESSRIREEEVKKDSAISHTALKPNSVMDDYQQHRRLTIIPLFHHDDDASIASAAYIKRERTELGYSGSRSSPDHIVFYISYQLFSDHELRISFDSKYTLALLQMNSLHQHYSVLWSLAGFMQSIPHYHLLFARGSLFSCETIPYFLLGTR